jgi:hypothetical protein
MTPSKPIPTVSRRSLSPVENEAPRSRRTLRDSSRKMQKRTITALICFSLFIGVAAGVIFVLTQDDAPLASSLRTAGAVVDNVGEQEGNAGLVTHVDAALGVEFTYPSEWGPVSAIERQGLHLLILEGLPNAPIVLVASDSNKYNEGRGGFWGDGASQIMSANDITHFCDGNSNCNVSTNAHGLLLAEHVFTPDTESGPERTFATSQFYFYNPQPPYHGVVASPVRIAASDTNDLEALFRDIMDTVRLVPVTKQAR